MTDPHITQPIPSHVTREEHAMFAELMKSELRGVRNEIQDVAAVSVENRTSLKEINTEMRSMNIQLVRMAATSEAEKAVQETRGEAITAVDFMRKYWHIILILLSLLGFGSGTAISAPSQEEVNQAAQEAAKVAVQELLKVEKDGD